MPFFSKNNKTPLGIYVHIPFCRSKCQYCDFYSLTTKDDHLLDGYLDAVCDRCGEDYEDDIEYPLDVVLVTELADEDHEDEGIFPLEGNFADMDEIIRTVFILNMDTKFLCSDDCLGLCCGCGVNLNRESCRCQKEIDPRFAALQQLLNK